ATPTTPIRLLTATPKPISDLLRTPRKAPTRNKAISKAKKTRLHTVHIPKPPNLPESSLVVAKRQECGSKRRVPAPHSQPGPLRNGSASYASTGPWPRLEKFRAEPASSERRFGFPP